MPNAPKYHAISLRLFVNAGMRFPLCYANARLLDTDKGRLPMSRTQVTCKRCLDIKRRENHA